MNLSKSIAPSHLRAPLLASLLLCGPSLASPPATGGGCDGPVSAVRLNQVGFYAAGDKLAVIVAPGMEPVPWQLVDDAGTVLARGETRVFGDDPASGEHVHLADFSQYRGMGRDLRIRTRCATSHPFVVETTPLANLKYDALAYFYHNRSGTPIDAAYAGRQWARPAGHARDTATCRSGKDRHGNRWPGCEYTLDLTGGWYDAGDHGKYVVNAGIAVWTLLNLHEWFASRGKDDPFGDGLADLPEAGNGVNDLLDEVRFEMEFLLRMQAPLETAARVPVDIPQNRPGLEFSTIDASSMAHHKVADENWTSIPMPPHLDEERRFLYPVSTAATLNLAATAAQCARIWQKIDDAFSRRCLQAAERAFAAAVRNPRVYFIADFDGSGMYDDKDLQDEFFWAAAELFITTGDASYEAVLRASPYFAGKLLRKEPAWPRVAGLGVISLAMLANDLGPEDVQTLRARVIGAASRFSAQRRKSGYHIPYAESRYVWGSNSNILNRAIILALAYDFTGDEGYRSAVTDTLDYLLGRNPLDQSYVSGYGDKPMQNPHHRFWAPSYDAALPPPPPGALSGGPNSTRSTDTVAGKMLDAGCAPQACWADDARAYSLNEVAINWNAPLVWVSSWADQALR